MIFPGYWVSFESGRAVLIRTTFDETDLDPATNWKEAWQNQDEAASCKGYVDLAAALLCAAHGLAASKGQLLSQSETDQINRFEPEWISGSYEIKSLSQIFGKS